MSALNLMLDGVKSVAANFAPKAQQMFNGAKNTFNEGINGVKNFSTNPSTDSGLLHGAENNIQGSTNKAAGFLSAPFSNTVKWFTQKPSFSNPFQGVIGKGMAGLTAFGGVSEMIGDKGASSAINSQIFNSTGKYFR